MINSSVKLLFAGDYHIYGRYDKFITKNSNHPLFNESLIDILSSSDLKIFNLEDPISSSRNSIIKHGPIGVGSKESLIPLKKAGFNIATCATNHSYDLGNQGIIETQIALKNSGIDLTGVGLTLEEAKRILYRIVNGTKIAILNFSRTEYNDATAFHGGANPLDIFENSKDIIIAKKNADFVFLVVHEGLDTYPFPYPKLVKQMRYYIDMGADAIIMHHSRVISGYEIYKGRPIFYGLGNILHWTKNQEEREGLFVEFVITSTKSLKFKIYPIEFNQDNVCVSLCDEAKSKIVMNKVEEISCIIRNEKLLLIEWNKFVKTRASQYLSILSGYPRIIYRLAKKLKLLGLYNRLLIINKRKYLALLNILKCQAHYETTKDVLIKLFEENEK